MAEMTLQQPDDPVEAQIVEYVVGTMTAAERAAFAAEMARDPALAQRVRYWQDLLVPLADGVGPVRPSAGLWLRVAASLGAAPAVSAPPVAIVADGSLIALRRSRALWRGIAAGAAGLAASLAIFVAGERLVPRVPEPGLVAVVNRSGELPALIVRVDPAAGTVQVRSLATEEPAGRSLELWSIVGKDKPRSLGLIAPGATRISVPDADRSRLEGATLAVTVEPRGGTGAKGPTGPIVYSGRLVSERD